MATTKQAAPAKKSEGFQGVKRRILDHRGMCYHRIHIVLHMVR